MLQFVFLVVLLCLASTANGFGVQHARLLCSWSNQMRTTTSLLHQSSSTTSTTKPTKETKGYAKKKPTESKNTSASIDTIKNELVDLIPRMTGQPSELRRVEELVNQLEALYSPITTLDFLNLAMQGDWQLLFSTNLSGTPNPIKFRMRQVLQTVACQGRTGTICHRVSWDLAETNEGDFDITGSFTVANRYNITQGARQVVQLDDHVLQIQSGPVPKDVPGLVGWLHRSMPNELFDATNHAMDTTYLDTNLKIVRYTGPTFEGVRNIFMRDGAVEIAPE